MDKSLTREEQLASHIQDLLRLADSIEWTAGNSTAAVTAQRLTIVSAQFLATELSHSLEAAYNRTLPEQQDAVSGCSGAH